ncbi:MAG: hypothetical protein ACI8SE_000495 [Bacteroidia bacterium]|jgi:hypothetical protein
MNKVLKLTVVFSIGVTLLLGCKQSSPPARSVNTEVSGRVGDSIRFAGLDWTVKVHETGQWGPGPNYFSGNEQDITIDSNGYLHMKIVNRDGKWFSTEVVSDKNMGYGTYVFTIDADLEDIPENIVLGLFTWDNNTFQSDANSEIDIEISKWGDTTDLRTLQYGVQPINFGVLYPERMHRPEYPLGKLKGLTTHGFRWSDSTITWASYSGDTYGQGELLGEWQFDTSFPARVKEEGGSKSVPVIIPAPGSETNARINLWIATWYALGPANGKEQEIIIRDFDYSPL